MLEGVIRESTGKKASKKLRKEGYLIANLYSKHKNINAAFKLSDFLKTIHHKKDLIFQVKIGNEVYDVLIQEYQKDPVTDKLIHVDLRIVERDEVSRYLIPVKTKGTPIGLKNKGVLLTFKNRLRVKCKGSDIPNYFVLDVTNLDVGDSILVRDIETKEGVVILEKPDVAVVGVVKAK